MIWFVALGGALGSVARYLLGTVFEARSTAPFPTGTLVINVTGSLLLGLVVGFSLAGPGLTREARALLATGLCGGYTTFSTFSLDVIRLLEVGDYRRAAVYAVLSLVLSLAATGAGLAIMKQVR
ncbi:MAG: fluoride efflux transporter CrcB [Gemmatimonadales bacterium]